MDFAFLDLLNSTPNNERRALHKNRETIPSESINQYSSTPRQMYLKLNPAQIRNKTNSAGTKTKWVWANIETSLAHLILDKK